MRRVKELDPAEKSGNVLDNASKSRGGGEPTNRGLLDSYIQEVEMLPWGEGATLSEELTLEALGSHGGVPRILLAIQVFDEEDGMRKTETYPLAIKRNWRVNI